MCVRVRERERVCVCVCGREREKERIIIAASALVQTVVTKTILLTKCYYFEVVQKVIYNKV